MVRLGDVVTLALDRSVRVIKVEGFCERRGQAAGSARRSTGHDGRAGGIQGSSGEFGASQGVDVALLAAYLSLR